MDQKRIEQLKTQRSDLTWLIERWEEQQDLTGKALRLQRAAERTRLQWTAIALLLGLVLGSLLDAMI